jgi:hypothetical protein
MNISAAQREVRSVFVGGFAGQLVSSGVWCLSAALATWSSPARGIYALVLGGFFIFPLTQLLLRLMGRPVSLDPGNPMRWLAMQVAFTLPLNLPLVAAATMYRPNDRTAGRQVALTRIHEKIQHETSSHSLHCVRIFGLHDRRRRPRARHTIG